MRPLKERVFIPVSRLLARRFSPNALTLLSLAFGIVSAVFVFFGLRWPGLFFWVLNRLADGFDGTVARLRSRQTDFGAYIDILSDFVVYALLPLAFAAAHDRWVVAGILLGAFYVNAASWMYLSALLEKRRAGAAAKGELTGVTMPEGIVGGVETMVFFTAFFLFPSILAVLFTAMAILVLGGVVLRVRWALRNLRP